MYFAILIFANYGNQKKIAILIFANNGIRRNLFPSNVVFPCLKYSLKIFCGINFCECPDLRDFAGLILRMSIFEIFCEINFCECLSLKYFAGFIFAKRAEIRKNKYRKDLYRNNQPKVNGF